MRGLHEVNQVAIAVGLYLLDHPEVMEANLRQLEEGRRMLADFARRHGFGFPDCPANFQLIALPERIDARGVVEAVKARGFLIKGGLKAPAVRNCLRISLTSPEVMSRFVATLEAVIADESRDLRAAAGSRRAPA